MFVTLPLLFIIITVSIRMNQREVMVIAFLSSTMTILNILNTFHYTKKENNN